MNNIYWNYYWIKCKKERIKSSIQIKMNNIYWNYYINNLYMVSP